MEKRQYKFSYTPEYSDIIYAGIFLIGGGTVVLLKNPLFIPLVWALVIGGIYFFIKQRSKIYFFEDFIEIAKGLGKSINVVRINYTDVQYVEYSFSEMGRGNLFKMFFLKNGKIRRLQYTFMGSPTSFEVSFFKGKGIPIKVVPESAKYKLDNISK